MRILFIFAGMKWIISVVFTLVVLTVVVTGCSRPSDSGSASLDASEMAEAIIDESTAIEIEEEPAIEEPAIDTAAIDGLKTAAEAIAWMDASPDADKYREGILHRMAGDCLDYTRRLLKNKFDYFIVVDKRSMFVVLFDKFGREKSAYKMACARNYGTKHKKNDCRTPEGFFSAGDTYDSTDWLYTDENGYTSPTKGVYGPRFIRVVNPATTTVGIHGTGSPWSLGARASHGCIRLANNSILDLVQYARKGMPIIVNPSDRDQRVNRQEGYTVAQINIGKPEHILAYEPEKKEETVSVSDTASAAVAADTAVTAIATPGEPSAEDDDEPSAASAADPVYD